MRRTPFGYEKAEEAHFQKIIDANVIQPSTLEWSSAPVLVRKDGSVRWCIDIRQLNQKTAKDSYPLPNIGDCLSTLSGSIYFSTLEMESGYYQVEIDPALEKRQHSLPGLDYLSMFVCGFAFVMCLPCS